MKKLLFPFVLFVLFSCGNEPKYANDVVEVKEKLPALPIREFIKKFKIIQTPFYYLGGYAGTNYEKQLFKLNSHSNDTLFYRETYDLPVYGYGMLPDTSNFYSVILFHTGEDLYPALYTYSKSGQLLSEESLVVRGCGSDCGLRYCSFAAHIDKDLSIYLADTAYYETMCDSTGEATPNSDSTFIWSKTGSINKSGVIKMSEELEQRLGGKK